MTLAPMYRCSLERLLNTKLPGSPGKKAHALSALLVVRNRNIPVELVQLSDDEKPVGVLVTSTDYLIDQFSSEQEAQGFIHQHQLTLNEEGVVNDNSGTD